MVMIVTYPILKGFPKRQPMLVLSLLECNVQASFHLISKCQ